MTLKIETIEGTDEMQMFVFMLKKQIFAVDILHLKEISTLKEITRIPNVPEFVLGIINLKGRIVPVIDLTVKLNLEPEEISSDTKLIVIRIDDKLACFKADKMVDVVDCDKKKIKIPTKTNTSLDIKFLQGLAQIEDQFIPILNVNMLLTNKEKVDLFRVGK